MAYIGSNPRQIPLIKEVGVGLPVGAIVEFPLNKVSAGFLKTTGEKYNPATFPALYEVLKTDTLPFREHDTKLGGVKWFNSRSEIGPDFVPADGQALTNGFSLYPDLLLLVSTGKVPTTDDTKWRSDPTMRGCFTTTTSGNEIRVPDYNGKSEGSLGAVVLRGDGKNAANPGVIQGDAIRNIAGWAATVSNQTGAGSTNWGGWNDATGAFSVGNNGTTYRNTSGSPETRPLTLKFDASLVVPTAPENRMVNTAGCWGVRVQVSTEFAIKAFDNITPEGVVEVAGLVQENIELRQAIDELNSWPKTGSNANGTWIKHKDGTLECLFVGNMYFRGAVDYVSLYQSEAVWTYPMEFVNNPIVTTGSFKINSGAQWFGVTGVPSVSNCVLRYWDVVAVAAGNATVSVRAIGRWK